MIIIASALTHLTDARYFAARGASWLSYDLRVSSPLSLPQAKAIIAWVEGPKQMGEFDLQTADEIRQIATALSLSGVQIGHFAELEVAKSLENILIFKEIKINNDINIKTIEETLAAFAPYVAAFVLDFGAVFPTFNWLDDAWRAALRKYSIVLKMNFQADSILEMLGEASPLGIALEGGEEERVGLKSYDELDDVFDRLEAASLL